MTAMLRRKTPEELLREVQAEEAALKKTGHLKIILGYASGVGKTYRLLDEARRRQERGQDVVVCAIQPNVPTETKPLLNKLEVVPLLQLPEGSAIDVDTVIRRHPMVCFVDGLAYDNPPGARNPARWQDVQELVAAGIKVIGSINVQYIEELSPQIEAITGARKQPSVPIAFLESASEIEIVDAPPSSPTDEATEQRLSKLRELALVLAADVVDHQLTTYLERHGIRQQFGTQERILVCIDPYGNLQKMLIEARLVADRFHGELIAARVRQHRMSTKEQSALANRLEIAHAADVAVVMLEGDDPADTLLEFARSRRVTQIFVGQNQRTGRARLWRSPLDKLIWDGHGMDVHVFP